MSMRYLSRLEITKGVKGDDGTPCTVYCNRRVAAHPCLGAPPIDTPESPISNPRPAPGSALQRQARNVKTAPNLPDRRFARRGGHYLILILMTSRSERPSVRGWHRSLRATHSTPNSINLTIRAFGLPSFHVLVTLTSVLSLRTLFSLILSLLE